MKEQNNNLLKNLLTNNRMYIENCLKIVNKDGELVPFKLNDGQIIVDNIIKDLEARNKPVRLIILKARQMGISTYTEGYIFKKTVTQTYKSSSIIAHLDEASQNLYNMYKNFYENMPDALKPMKKYLNSDLLEFANPSTNEEDVKRNPGLKSKVTIKTAKNAKSGRSQTIHYLHASEVAFWDDAKTLMTGLMQTIPNKPNTAVILESTANGIGGYFYDVWERAMKGENAFTPIFLPWFVDTGYKMDFETEQEREDFIAEVEYEFKNDKGETIYTDEKELMMMVERDWNMKLSYEQLKWRRWCIANNCNADIEQFQQEYPSTPEEAFIASGRPRFNVSKLKKYLRHTEDGIRGNLYYDGQGRVHFEKNKDGYITMWNAPKPDRYYCIGGDVAEGLIDGDYSVGIVGSQEDLKVDAMFHGHIDPDLFGAELVKLAKFYNDAYIGVEANNHGLTTLKAIQKLDYYNIYFSKVYDQITDKITQKIGWQTNAKTKPLMIDKLAEFIREEYIGIKSKLIIRELLTYVIDDKDSTNAQEGCHDDTVMALAIWLQVILEGRGDSYTPEISDERVKSRANFDIDRPSLYRERDEDEEEDEDPFIEYSI